MKKYQHLSIDERNQIVVLVNRGQSLREIAIRLGRNVSTLAREIKRNHGKKVYRAHRAHERAVFRHHQSHKRMRLKSHALRLEVEKLIMQGWSPELIAGRLRTNSEFPAISHEAIYQWIYDDAPHLIGSLVRSHPSRWPKGKGHRNRKSHIPYRISIAQRPEVVQNRKEAGHWETDLLIGKGKSALQVTVERQSRFTRIKKIPTKTAVVSRLALYSILSPLPPSFRRSITYDNGFENIEHHLLNQQLGTSSYFCQPYHSWEKGTVENTNGLIRRFLPKKTNFDIISDQQLQQVESWLNSRPRKCLNFKTPAESFHTSVALTT